MSGILDDNPAGLEGAAFAKALVELELALAEHTRQLVAGELGGLEAGMQRIGGLLAQVTVEPAGGTEARQRIERIKMAYLRLQAVMEDHRSAAGGELGKLQQGRKLAQVYGNSQAG